MDVPVLLCGTEPLCAVTARWRLYRDDSFSHRVWRVKNYWMSQIRHWRWVLRGRCA